MQLEQLRRELKKKADPKRAKLLQGFFKTGPGEYGEGDVFLGITVPESRKTAKKFKDLPLADVKKLLKSKYHEERLVALLILVHVFQSEEKKREAIYAFYLKNTKYINNWDLVDLSAHKIVGPWLEDKPRAILTELAKSKNLWERRIAILSTFHFINKGDCKDALRIAKMLLHDKHDLIHKAVGWMLREVGKRCSMKEEEDFLRKHYREMPRTMLRYAIERFPEKKRQGYLKGTIS